jgi:hypothetical protein
MESRGWGGGKSIWRLIIIILFPALGLVGVQSAMQAQPNLLPVAAPAKEVLKVVGGSESYCRARFSSPFRHLVGETVVEELRAPGSAIAPAPVPAGDELSTELTEMMQRLSQRVDIDVIIAALPDPTTSGLGYQFDAELEALVLSMEVSTPSKLWSQPTLSYNRDRGWLPWSDLAVSKDLQAQSVGCRHEWPGVVLFRAAGPVPSIMILLLVGESPISGVSVAAMHRALELSVGLVRHPHGLNDSGKPGTGARETLVLGPTFSGSASSLRRALDEHGRKHPAQRVHVVSGTATGPDVPAIIDPQLGAGLVLYQTTTIAGQDLVCSFLHTARRAGARTGVGGPRKAVDGVAILRESGTEFGTTLGRNGSGGALETCPLEAEIELSFPFHVSAIRDAYEELDSSQRKIKDDPSVERHTALEISLRGGPRLDLEAPQSTVTKFAQDLALSNVLGEISREGVRWLGIQATDIADAIFLARKIRDVAPDVRLAFFTADALLLHPSFRSDLLGSLVITPYPFLGSDDFWPRTRMDSAVAGVVRHSHASFPNAEAEGSFNAVLALRGMPTKGLMEYAFIEPAAGEPTQPLPVWTAVIARAGIVPLRVAPALDCSRVIFGNGRPAPSALCTPRTSERSGDSPEWAQFNSLRDLELHVDPDVTPPRLWNFVFGLLVFGCLLHWWFDHHVDAELQSDERFPNAIRMEASGLKPTDEDSRLDRCIVRSKWHLYALFAQLTLSIAATYFFAIYAIAMTTYARHDGAYKLTIITGASFALLMLVSWRTSVALRRSWREIRAFARSLTVEGGALLRSNGLPGQALLDQADVTRSRAPLPTLLLWLGFADARPLGWSVYVSYAQLRGLFWVGLLGTFVFVGGLAWSLWHDTDVGHGLGNAVPALTLFALRSLPLTNGVSPALPLLLVMGCTYWWAMGRMARLRVLHALARMSPDDHVMDCVSTPIRAVLFPTHDDQHPADEGFTANERMVINQVLRPNGYSYLFAMFFASFLPLLLFTLKRPTTLEPEFDTYLLFLGLAVCALLVCATLVQMMNYWSALRCLLRRLMAHPIGGAFKRVPEPIRAALDQQVSRSSDDLREVAACADAYGALFLGDGERMWNELATPFSEDAPAPHRRERIAHLRRLAMGQASLDGDDLCSAEQKRDKLGMQLLTAANEMVARVLLRVWDPSLLPSQESSSEDSAAAEQTESGPVRANTSRSQGNGWHSLPPGALGSFYLGRVAGASTPVPPHDDRFSVAVAAIREPDHRAWLARAETYVATVVAVLVLRHVRQFKYFLYTTTGCALMLLAAVASYPFEPHRALMLCMWLLIGAVVASSLWIYVQLDIDPLLSHLAGDVSSAGKVTWNSALAQRVVIWFLLPIVSLLAAQYPGVSRQLAHVLEPFMRVLQ